MKAKPKTISATNKALPVNGRGFTLIEVLITVAILSTGIIFLFRSFTASLLAARFSQNITLACYFAEDKFFDIQNKRAPMDEGAQTVQNINLRWKYEIGDTDTVGLKKLSLLVSWKEKARGKEYSMEFSSLLPETR